MNDKALQKSGIPGYLQDYKGGQLQDNFDSTDIAIPQVRLLQGVSEAISLFDDAKVGEFWHTGMDQPLGDELKFVIASRRKRYLLQAPMDDGQGILARADDGATWDRLGKWSVKVDKKTTVDWEISDLNVEKSGLTQWGTFDPTDSQSPPAATLFYDYLVLLPDHMEFGPAVISLARSAIRKARRGLNDKISLHQRNQRPMQSVMFAAQSSLESGDTGDFFTWGFRQMGFADEDVFNQAMALGKEMTDYRVKDEVGAEESA